MARTRRVVVVGCDREHLELLKMVLKANNCGGATSTTARGAAMAMMAEYTHLVIVDLGHRWQGLEIVKMLQQVNKKVPMMLVAFEQIWLQPEHDANCLLEMEEQGMRGLLYQAKKMMAKNEWGAVRRNVVNRLKGKKVRNGEVAA